MISHEVETKKPALLERYLSLLLSLDSAFWHYYTNVRGVSNDFPSDKRWSMLAYCSLKGNASVRLRQSLGHRVSYPYITMKHIHSWVDHIYSGELEYHWGGVPLRGKLRFAANWQNHGNDSLQCQKAELLGSARTCDRFMQRNIKHPLNTFILCLFISDCDAPCEPSIVSQYFNELHPSLTSPFSNCQISSQKAINAVKICDDDYLLELVPSSHRLYKAMLWSFSPSTH